METPTGKAKELSLEQMVSPEELQRLIDDFYQLTGFHLSIVNPRGDLLAGAGWQEVCRSYHRQHPETLHNCWESDTSLAGEVPPGSYKIYQCKNHMWHVVSPINIEGSTVGNIFLSQFFYQEEPVDFQLFRRQAHRYGFDPEAYLEAVAEVPTFNREQVDRAINYFTSLAHIISRQGYQALKLSRELQTRKEVETALRESQARTLAILNTIPDLMFIFDRNGVYLDFHAPHQGLLADYPENFLHRSLHQVLPREVAEPVQQALQEAEKTNTTQRVQYPLETLGGEKYFEARITPMEGGKFLSIVRDITKEKGYELRLEEERDYMFRLFDTMEQHVIVNSLDYRIEFLNRRAREAFGDLVGEVCYQQLGKEKPCPTCPLPRIGEEYGPESLQFDVEAGGRILQGTSTLIKNLDGTFSALEVLEDVTERRLAEERVKFLSFHDRLTGLYNRAYLEEEMRRLDTKRQLPLSLLMVDLNGLKLINDTYGHWMGDQFLRGAAETLLEACRQEDIIGRWGGDEFVILLPKTGRGEAETLYNRLLEGCSQVYVENLPLSVAVGLAVKESPEKPMSEVLKEAEDEMYREKVAESRSEKSAVLSALLHTLAEKSFETEAHTRRMEKVALRIGEHIELSDSEMNRLKLLITLHDIGKINLPEEVLTKEGPLTQEEWETVKKHPETGYRIARATEKFAHVAREILHHHERWDGEGYPQGLQGEEIPLLSRITAIADAFEVMSHGRPYKKALDLEEIIQEFRRCTGTQFDPELVEVFLTLLQEEKWQE